LPLLVAKLAGPGSTKARLRRDLSLSGLRLVLSLLTSPGFFGIKFGVNGGFFLALSARARTVGHQESYPIPEGIDAVLS